MSVASVINEMKDNLPSDIVTDQKQVCRMILKAHNIFLLDTGFISRIAHMCDAQSIGRTFEKFSNGKTSEDMVFVITELILYELKNTEDAALTREVESFLIKICQEGYVVLLLTEETIYKELSEYLTRNTDKWNKFMVSLIHNNVAVLKNICSIIKSDEEFPYKNLMETGYIPSKNQDYITNIIRHIKRRKKDRDSLGEELICISLLFFGELCYKADYNHFFFCSYDRPAAVMMNMAVRTQCGNKKNLNYECIYLLDFIQYMITEGILVDRQVVEDILINLVGQKIKVIENKRAPLHSEQNVIPVTEAVELMFSGKELSFV